MKPRRTWSSSTGISPVSRGLELLRCWRRRGPRPRVIMVTARDAVADRVVGLESGAQDYLVKPFATEELLARVHVQLRDVATPRGHSSTLRLEGCQVDLARQIVRRGAEKQPLTAQETRTLALLASRAGKTVSRADLLREVWGYRSLVQTRAVDNTIFRLRAKVENDPATPRHLITVHGEGYRFEP